MDNCKENSVVRVSFAGGIIGILAGSHRGRLETAILKQNKDRWNLAEVIPDNPNLIIWIFRFVLLIVTLGLWTISTGYILVFERPSPFSVGDIGDAAPNLNSDRGLSQ